MTKVKTSRGGAAMNCCVPLCPSSRQNRSITYYRFPKRRKFKEEWIRALTDVDMLSALVGKDGLENLSRLFICSRHFSEDDFQDCPSINTKTGQRSLKDDAIPSVFVERIATRKSTQQNTIASGSGSLQMKRKQKGSLISENGEVPIATVALCMKKAVTSFKLALQNFEKDKEQNTSKLQTILPPAPPSVIDVKAISIRSTRSTKSKPLPLPAESKVAVKQEQDEFPSKPTVKQEAESPSSKPTLKQEEEPLASKSPVKKVRKKTQTPSKSFNPQSLPDKRVTRTLANKVASHELSQCTSPTGKPKLDSSLKTPSPEPAVKPISHIRLPSVKSKSKPTLKRLPDRKSAPPASIKSISKSMKAASSLLYKAEKVKGRKSTSSLVAIRNKKIEKVRRSLMATSHFRKQKKSSPISPITPIAMKKKMPKIADFLMSRSGGVSDDSERKQAGFVQSMFSQVITKVFADAVSAPRRRRRTTKTFNPAKVKLERISTDNGTAEWQGGEKPPWEVDGADESGTVNGDELHNKDVKFQGYQYHLLDMNVDSDEDDEGGSEVGDPLSVYQNIVTSRNVKVDIIDIDDNEYGTPLLKGFGFDMDSTHDVLEHDLQNSPGNALMIPPEGCEYASDASEGADDNYYALIPKIEVNEHEVEFVESISASTSNGVKVDANDDVPLAANTQVIIKTEICGS